ncbi:MAG: SRPBCC domain-containing protein [Bacteroidota bacterium]
MKRFANITLIVLVVTNVQITIKAQEMKDGNKPIITKKIDLVVKRIIDAPVDLVWKAWTDPKHVVKWWGPEGFTSPTCKIDLHEGGSYIFCMRAPAEMGGFEHYSAGVYKKIIPEERLEFTQSLSDNNGNPLEPSAAGMTPDFPRELIVVVEFKKLSCDMTEITITEHEWAAGQMYVYSLAGLQQTIDKLSAVVK